jgi:superoxide dismutase, Fe-Mn family
MTFILPKLPFAKDALKPYISEETLEFHYGKHHFTYLTNLNKLISGTEFEKKTLTDIVQTSSGSIFNNAAQHMNHTFYWNCLTPNSNCEPSQELLAAINGAYGTFEKFKHEFINSASALFGSGWTWLIKNNDGVLSIINMSNAGNPIVNDQIPLLVCDVWEHAYYIDYRNTRDKYLNNYWHVVNWKFVNQNFLKK